MHLFKVINTNVWANTFSQNNNSDLMGIYAHIYLQMKAINMQPDHGLTRVHIRHASTSSG